MACTWEPYGAIGDRWRSKGAERSPFGCTTHEHEWDIRHPTGWAGRNGKGRNYTNGQMVWSPGYGPGMIVSAYRAGGRVVVEWGFSYPTYFDKWIVRWDVAPGDPRPANSQRDVNLDTPGRTPTGGFFHIDLDPLWVARPGPDGKVCGLTFIVEGFGPHGGGYPLGPEDESPLDWTCPISVRL